MKNTGHITPSRKKQVEMWPIWCVLSPRQDAFIFDNAQFNMKDFMMVLLPVEYFRSKTQELSLIWKIRQGDFDIHYEKGHLPLLSLIILAEEWLFSD